MFLHEPFVTLRHILTYLCVVGLAQYFQTITVLAADVTSPLLPLLFQLSLQRGNQASVHAAFFFAVTAICVKDELLEPEQNVRYILRCLLPFFAIHREILNEVATTESERACLLRSVRA